jgi:NADH-quinone oxidoreductase subunit N
MDTFNPFPIGDLQKILPVLALLTTGTAVLVIDLFLRSWHNAGDQRVPPGGKGLLPALAIAGSAAAIVLAYLVHVRSAAAGTTSVSLFGGALRLDLFSLAVTGTILIGTLMTVLSAAGYLSRLGMQHGEFYALVLYAAAAMVLLAQSENLILIFLSLETFSMAVYVLAAFTRDAQRSVEGALKYFVLGGVAGAFLLFGLALVYGATGEIRLQAIGESIARGRADLPLLLAGCGMALVGFGFKVGAFPFHSWIPDAYEGAPTLVSGFMSVTVKAAAFAVLLRFSLLASSGESLPEARLYLGQTVAWLALATMVFGNLVALVQTSVKRMLAYSAISHTGYLLVGLAAALKSASPDRGASIVFYLLPYTLMTFGAFAVLAALGRDRGEDETYDSFRGLSTRRPFLALVMLLFMISLAGIPPTAGFWSKFYLFREAVLAGEWPLALAGVLTSMFSAYYYLRLVVVMYMQPEGDDAPAGLFEATWSPVAAAAITAAGVVAIGILPEDFLELSVRSIKSVLAARP